MTLESKNIIIGVCGGIAAYRAAELCSLLRKEGAAVRVVMTRSAIEFVQPLTFETLTQHRVYVDLFDRPSAYEMEHISWARWGDALVIAPATANVLAKMTCGIADDALTTLYLSFERVVMVAPAMNTRMLEHPATQSNLKTLEQRGVIIVPAGVGHLACGESGAGRLAEPAEIVRLLKTVVEVSALPADTRQVDSSEKQSMEASSYAVDLRDETLKGKVVVITSGPTHEYIDPVRFITNPSSGKMGAALAREAARRGAEVDVVSGPVAPAFLAQDCARIHKVTTAEQMLMGVQALADKADVFIFAAAVSDYRVDRPAERKMKRTGNAITLSLVENPDIAQVIGTRKRPGQVAIGFAAETEGLEANALAKLSRKHLDAIVANDVANPRIGFESDHNEVTIYLQDGSKQHISCRPKEEVAKAVFDVAVQLLERKAKEKRSQE